MCFKKAKIFSIILSIILIMVSMGNMMPINAETAIPDQLTWDFNDGNATGWEVPSGEPTYGGGWGTWAVDTDTGTYKQSAAGNNNPAITVTGETGWKNYSIEADITPLSANNNNNFFIGFAVGVGDDITLNRCLIQYGKSTSTTTVCRTLLRKGSTTSDLNSTSLGTPSEINLGQTYHMKAVMNNSSVTIYIDGNALCRKEDVVFANGGKVGLTTAYTSALFDNVTIKSLDAQNPQPSETPALSKTILYSNFDNGDVSLWSAPSGEPTYGGGWGTWAVDTDTGSYKQSAIGNNNPAAVLAGETSWGDYSIEADITPLATNNNNNFFIGFAVGVGDDFTTNRCLVQYGKSTSTTTVCRTLLRKGSTTSDITSTSLGTPPEFNVGQTYHMKAIMDKISVTIYIDGVPLCKKEDAAFANGGKVGLMTAYASALFDNVVVRTKSVIGLNNMTCYDGDRKINIDDSIPTSANLRITGNVVKQSSVALPNQLKFVVGIYNSNCKLFDYNIIPIDLSSNTTFAIDSSLSTPPNTEGCYVKAFVWDFTNIEPIIDQVYLINK